MASDCMPVSLPLHAAGGLGGVAAAGSRCLLCRREPAWGPCWWQHAKWYRSGDIHIIVCGTGRCVWVKIHVISNYNTVGWGHLGENYLIVK